MEELTGHNSAASLPTGPVMAEPFISPLGLTICGHVSYCVVLYFGGAQEFVEFSARVHPQLAIRRKKPSVPVGKPSSLVCRLGSRMNTYHTGVVLKVQEDTVESLPGLGLSDDDGGVDLLSQLGLSLLDGGHDHVTDTTGGETVQAGADALDRDDVQVSGARVVGAVHDGTAAEAVLVSFLPLLFGAHLGVLGAGGRACWRRGQGTYTGRPRVILSLPPGAPRLYRTSQSRLIYHGTCCVPPVESQVSRMGRRRKSASFTYRFCRRKFVRVEMRRKRIS